MQKSVFLLGIIICIAIMASAYTFAAPQTLDPNYIGTADLITVTNPNNGITTFKNYTLVSVLGEEDVEISLYKYNPTTKRLTLYTEKNGRNTWYVGSSGLFIKRLPISNGVNYIGIFAGWRGYDQLIIRRVDKGSMTIGGGIKNILIKSMEDIVQTGN